MLISPAFILVCTALVNCGLLFVMLTKRPSGTPSRPLMYFGLGIIFLLLWSLANYFVDTSSTAEQALFWTRFTFVPGLLSCLCILFFAKLFPVPDQSVAKYWVAPTLAVFCANVLVFTPLGVKGVLVVPGVGVTEVELGSAYIGILLVLLYVMLYATYSFYKKMKVLTGSHYSQVKLALIGWGLFLGFAFLVNALLPLLTGDATWGKFGPLGSSVMVGFITYAIVRHEMFDIKIIIQRGLIYSVLFSLSALVYVALLFVIEQVFSRGVEVDAVVGAFLTAMIAVYSAAPLERYFRKLTDPIFFKNAYDYALVMAELAEVLNRNISEKVIIKKATAVLTQALHPTLIVFQIGAQTPPKESALTIAIKTKEKQIGCMYFGEKRSGDRYTPGDISLLTTFAAQAGVALEKARLYSEVKEYAHTLEKKVEDRTGEIIALHKEQESMMHEISHGLQTPLTIMKGELYFLRKQGYETEKIDIIDNSINRISVFINKLLGLYRLETAPSAKLQNVELRTSLQRVGEGLAGMMQERGIQFVLQAPKEIKIKGDNEGLEEVFSNLVHNAIKYAKPEGGTITVSLQGVPLGVEVRVMDTGIGIPNDGIEKLFTKFYRVRNESTRHVSGTGLGLVITKKIIERHGGSIRVESELGVGTTFIVSLPKKMPGK